MKGNPHRSYLASVIGCYCPRCREGKLFRHGIGLSLKKNMQMHKHCPSCGQVTEIEVGFYYGTGYVSYVLALILSGITFVTWWLFIGFSFADNRFIYWVASNAILLLLLQPWLMRVSRSLWLSWFVKYDPDWMTTPPETPERLNENQSNNW